MTGFPPMPVSRRSAGASAPTLVARSPAQSARRFPARAGAYQLTRFLNAGGMGVVFEARHRFGGERVAVKFMDPDAHYPNKDERFSREIVALRSLRHDGIARFVDFGRTSDGLRFLVMEYVPGETLSELTAREGALPLRRCVALLRQLCGALAEAHAAGVAHRDLKPSNVMVARAGTSERVKLIDFGLARLPDAVGASEACSPGIFLGTPGYAPPEVWSRTGVLGARGDVFAIGLIAHHLLTGCRPPDPVETLVHNCRRLIEDLKTRTPSWCVALIARCLSSDPGMRFADAGALLRALPVAHP